MRRVELSCHCGKWLIFLNILMGSMIFSCSTATSVSNVGKFGFHGEKFDQAGFFHLVNGNQVYYRLWNSANPQRTVVIFHGIGFHGKYYEELASRINKYSSAIVYIIDFPGHGLSSGERGKIQKRHENADIVNEIVEQIIQSHEIGQLHLIGESMGGLICLNFMADYHKESVRSVILIAPALELSLHQVFNSQTIKDMACFLFHHNMNCIALTRKRLQDASKNEEFIQEVRSDSLVLHSVSPNYILTLGSMIYGWKVRFPKKIAVPTLILHGSDDKILRFQASKKYIELSQERKKRLVLIPGAEHGLLWNDKKEVVFTSITDWLNSFEWQ